MCQKLQIPVKNFLHSACLLHGQHLRTTSLTGFQIPPHHCTHHLQIPPHCCTLHPQVPPHRCTSPVEPGNLGLIRFTHGPPYFIDPSDDYDVPSNPQSLYMSTSSSTLTLPINGGHLDEASNSNVRRGKCIIQIYPPPLLTYPHLRWSIKIPPFRKFRHPFHHCLVFTCYLSCSSRSSWQPSNSKD